MKRSLIGISLVVAALTGCVSSPAIRVTDAEGVESVSGVSMGCDSPFMLTRDCSGFSGPTLDISLGGHEVKVAGNDDQTVTVIFGGKVMSGVSQATNLGYELMKRELVKRGINIVKITPIESSGLMFGYAVETDVPNYQIWKEFKI